MPEWARLRRAASMGYWLMGLLTVRWPATGSKQRSLVAPVKDVQLCICIPMAHCQFPRRLDLEANGVADFRFLVFKPVGKNDPGTVFFTGDRIEDWFHAGLQDVGNSYLGASALAVRRDFQPRKHGLQNVGADGSEDLEVQPALLPTVECYERCSLGNRGLVVDDRQSCTVAFRD